MGKSACSSAANACTLPNRSARGVLDVAVTQQRQNNGQCEIRWEEKRRVLHDSVWKTIDHPIVDGHMQQVQAVARITQVHPRQATRGMPQ